MNEPKLETITPEQATLMLQNNPGNRPVRVKWVEALARDMKNGKFMTTHQGIAIAPNGEILDGQHRLMACALSGVPITVYVSRDYDPELMNFVDAGIVRSYRDRAVITGKYAENPVLRDTSTTSFVRKLIQLGYKPSLKPTDSDVDRLISQYYDNVVGVAKAFCNSSGTSAPINAAALAATMCGEPVEDIKRFYDVFLRGDSSRAFGFNATAAFNFSRAILDAKAKKMAFNSSKLFLMAQNAIWLFLRSSAPVQFIRETKTPRYPVYDKIQKIMEEK